VTYLERNCKFPDDLCARRPEHGDRVNWSRDSVDLVSSSELHAGMVGEQDVPEETRAYNVDFPASWPQLMCSNIFPKALQPKSS
jgi:hypothetical protein